MNILEGSEGQKVVLSVRNFIRVEEDGTGVYADHITKKLYRVNYSTRQLVDTTDVEDSLDGKVQDLVEVISAVLRKYLEEFFSQGSHIYGSKDLKSLLHGFKTSLRFQLQDSQQREQVVSDR